MLFGKFENKLRGKNVQNFTFGSASDRYLGEDGDTRTPPLQVQGLEVQTWSEESEEKYRMFLFKKKDAEIKAHNANSQNSYKLGHNQFSCLTFEEFENSYLGAIPPPE